MAKMFKKPTGRKTNKYFKTKTETSNRDMMMKRDSMMHKGKRFKAM